MSLSRIIKSTNAVDQKQKPRTITVRNFYEEHLASHEENEHSEQMMTAKNDEQMVQNIEKELSEAKEQAKEIIQTAQEEASALQEQLQYEREQAELEIQQSIKAGHEKGYEDGFTQGTMDAKKSYEEKIAQATSIIQESEREFEKTIDSAQPIIIELAAALARRMIGIKLEEQEDIWSSLLTQVMQEVREHEHVKLYVHPDWYEQTLRQKDELEQLLSHTEKLFIYPDAGLMPNGCVVESKYGRIDATIDRQLQQLKQQLLAKLEEGSNES